MKLLPVRIVVLLAAASGAAAGDASGLIAGLLKKLESVPAVKTCVADVAAVGRSFDAAAAAFARNSTTEALNDLYLGTRGISRAIDGCDVPVAAAYVEKGANALGFNATAAYVAGGLKISVLGLDATADVLGLLRDWRSGNATAGEAGASLGAFLLLLDTAAACDQATGKGAAEACALLDGVLGTLGVFLGDFAPCETQLAAVVDDAEAAGSYWKEGDGKLAFEATVQTLGAAGGAADACGLPAVAKVLQTSTGKLRGANVTGGVATALEVSLDGVEVSTAVMRFAAAAAAGNWSAAGADLAALVVEVKGVGCDGTACSLMAALADAFALVGEDTSGPCAADVVRAAAALEAGAEAVVAGDVAAGVAKLASGLREVGAAASACQLDALGTLIEAEATKLGAATVAKDAAGVFEVVVGAADVYDDVYDVAAAVAAGDWKRAGTAIGALVGALDALGCGANAGCEAVERVLDALQVVSSDLSGACAADLAGAWTELEAALAAVDAKDYETGVAALSAALAAVAKALDADCGLAKVAALVDAEAAALGGANVTAVSGGVAIVVEGADVAADLAAAAAAAAAGDVSTAGLDVGEALKRIGLAGCAHPLCEVLSAFLTVYDGLVGDAAACEADVSGAAADLEAAFAHLAAGAPAKALAPLSRALKAVGDGLDACQVGAAAEALKTVADSLGLADVADDAAVVARLAVAGTDVFDALGDAGLAYGNGSYALAGDDLARAVLGALRWNASNGCGSPACLLLQGGMQALGHLQGDMRACEADLESAWTNVSAAFDLLAGHAAFAGAASGVPKNDTVLWSDPKKKAATAGALHDVASIAGDLSKRNCATFADVSACDVAAKNLRHQRLFARIYRRRHNASLSAIVGWPSWDDLVDDFTQLVAHVEEDVDVAWADLVEDLDRLVGDDVAMTALSDLAAGLKDLAAAVGDCHMREFASLLEKLAALLGAPAGLGWLDEGFKIVVDAAEISNDVYDSLLFYKRRDYFMAGYEIAKLAMTLLA